MFSSSEVDDGPLKFASVKFIHNKQVDTIPIGDIDEFDELTWPDHEHEFEKNKIYTCTYQPKGSQVTEKFGIQISHFKCKQFLHHLLLNINCHVFTVLNFLTLLQLLKTS